MTEVNGTLEIPWYMMTPCSILYLMTQSKSFDNHPDREKVLAYLDKMEKVRPEDINGRITW